MPSYFDASVIRLPLYAGFDLYWVNQAAIADVDGDGRSDLIISYHANRDVALPLRFMHGDGSGGFTDVTGQLFPTNVPSATFPNQLVLADFNGDRRTDIFVVDHGYDVSPFPGFRDTLVLSSGAGGLTNAALVSQPDFGHSATAGDIDSDGDLDLYVGNIHGQADIGPYFLINNGAGAFTPDTSRLPAAISRMTGEVYTTSRLADFDGDGDVDLFLGKIGLDDSRSKILINEGGQFTRAILLPEPAGTATQTIVSAEAVDVNGDGRMDLLLSVAVDGYRAGQLQLLINQGGGAFVDETAQRLETFGRPLSPPDFPAWFLRTPFVDVNGDGAADIVLSTGSRTPILLNDGLGRFIAMPEGALFTPPPVASGQITFTELPSGVARPPPSFFVDRFAVGDVNGDGRLDLVSFRGTDFGAAEEMVVYLGRDPALTQTGTAAAEGFMADNRATTINAGAGDDVIVGGGGRDYLRGDEGNDRIAGGGDFDDINGNMGDDTASGGLGDDWVVGGKDNDLLSGDDGGDIVCGNLGNDTCEGGAGNDLVRGGQQDDIVSGGAGDDWLSGDRGSDTMTGGAGADVFHTFGDAGIDRVTDFSRAEGDRVQLDPGTTYATAQVGADTVITMGGGGQTILVGVSIASLTGEWIFGG